MTTQSHLQTLFAYHWHTTRRLMDCAAKLSEVEYTASSGYGRGSVHDLLVHLWRAARSWRLALETGRRPAPPSPEATPDLAALRARFAEEQANWEALLNGLSEAAIEGDVTITTAQGESWADPRWRILHHVILHGMQHHAELAQVLTAQGQSPGDLDFIFFESL